MSVKPRGSSFSSFRLRTLATLLALATTCGCGGSGTSGGADAKANSKELAAARESLATRVKVRGKTLPATSNLSVRERRALKQAGELPAK